MLTWKSFVVHYVTKFVQVKSTPVDFEDFGYNVQVSFAINEIENYEQLNWGTLVKNCKNTKLAEFTAGLIYKTNGWATTVKCKEN